jgi:hypothetical protein
MNYIYRLNDWFDNLPEPRRFWYFFIPFAFMWMTPWAVSVDHPKAGIILLAVVLSFTLVMTGLKAWCNWLRSGRKHILPTQS